MEEIMESPFWSDSEDEDLFYDHVIEREVINHLPDSLIKADLDDEELPFDSDAEEIERLQSEYAELVKKKSSMTRGFSTGPATSPIKSGTAPKVRKVYKSIPVNEAGEPEFPLVLGRAQNRISISKIGPIAEDGQGVLPLDYECRRKYQDFRTDTESKPVFYSCSVTGDSIQQAQFSINSTDAALDLLSGSMEALWEDFKAKFAESQQAQLDEDFPAGPRQFFGLEHENLAKYFREQLNK